MSSGIARVVVGTRDPNPRHGGRGLRLLRRAGVEVVTGISATSAAELAAPFAKWVTTGRPYLSLKMGMTLDGRIADARHRSRWITGPQSRHRVQRLRRGADAILVGGGTVRDDNPSLLASGRRRPYRVILSARGHIPERSRLLCDGARGQTILAATSACPARTRTSLERAGVQVWILPGGAGGVSLAALLDRLGRIDVLHVLCEGGGELAAALIRRRLVDEYLLFVAPKFLGGTKSVPVVGGRGWALDKMRSVAFESCEMIGDDLLIRAKPVSEQM